MTRNFFAMVAIALVALFVLFSSVHANPGESDLDPPHLVWLVVEPALVDTGQNAQTITVTARITDDLSGCSTVQPCATVVLAPLFGPEAQAREIGLVAYLGTANDALYRGALVLPQYSYEGRWGLASVATADVVNNACTVSVSAPAGCPFKLPVVGFVNVRDDADRSAFLPLIERTMAPTVGLPPTIPPAEIEFTQAEVVSCASEAYGTAVQGTITRGGQPVDGNTVVASTGPDLPPLHSVQAGPNEKQPGWAPGFFALLLNGSGPEVADWYFWIVDGQGRRISALTSVRFDGEVTENSCQVATVRFASE